MAHSGGDDSVAPKSLKVNENSYIESVLSDGHMYVNKQLIEGVPLMCAPIYYHDHIVAVVSINGLTFDKFSLYYQNLFKIVTDIVSSALTKAFMFIEATENKRYVKGTSVLKREAFEGVLKSKRLAKEQHNTPYSLLKA
jgi:hypothetical protein